VTVTKAIDVVFDEATFKGSHVDGLVVSNSNTRFGGMIKIGLTPLSFIT
jgi:hypothetical protein